MTKLTRLLSVAAPAVLAAGLAWTATAAGQNTAARPDVFDIRELRDAAGIPDAVVQAATNGVSRPLKLQQQTVLDDFESDPWPNSERWAFVGDLNEPVTGKQYRWAPSICRAASGQRSLWAIGGGRDGSLLECGAPYPNGVLSSAIMQLDLTNYAGALVLNLEFDFWLNTRTEPENGVAPDGLFVNYVEIDDRGNRDIVTIDGVTATFPDRFFDDPRQIDLLAAEEIYPPHRVFDFSGKSIYLEFLFVSSRAQSTLPEGVFIDDIRLEAELDPNYTPTTPTPTLVGTPPTATNTSEPTLTHTPGTPPTPTETATATEVVTATITSTPTETEVMTPTLTSTPTEAPPPPGTIYLPKLHQNRPGAPATVEPSPEPSPATPATPATPVDTPEPTAEPTEPGEAHIELHEVGGSGKTGHAILTETGPDLTVELTLDPADPGDAHPAHIHSGTCENGGGITHPLEEVVDGTSVTVLPDVSLAEVSDGAHYINVHESAENLGNTIACGDIPEVDAAEPTPMPTSVRRLE